MARKVRHSSLESRTARLKLAVRRKPYPGPKLGRGIHLLYRRNKTNGTWVLKASDHHGKYWTQRVAEADDHDESNGKTILNFFEAQDIAKKLARGGSLPPGWQKKIQPVPVVIEQRLAPLPEGYRRGIYDGAYVVYDSQRGLIVDLFLSF